MTQPRSCSRHTFFVNPLSLLFGSLALASCTDGGPIVCPDGSPTPCLDPIAELQVTTSTTGDDFDLNGYLLFVDEDTTLAGSNVSLDYTLDVGVYTVRLDDVADNCTVSGGSTRTATLTDGATAEVAFAVACTALPPATVDVAGTWIGQSTDISTYPLGTIATVTYVMQQTGDSVTLISAEWVGPVATFVSNGGRGRVSGNTVTLFETTDTETSRFRNTHILTVSGTEMIGTSTEQFGRYTDSLALTKQ